MEIGCEEPRDGAVFGGPLRASEPDGIVMPSFMVMRHLPGFAPARKRPIAEPGFLCDCAYRIGRIRSDAIRSDDRRTSSV
jgi:hypothetical protein